MDHIIPGLPGQGEVRGWIISSLGMGQFAPVCVGAPRQAAVLRVAGGRGGSTQVAHGCSRSLQYTTHVG